MKIFFILLALGTVGLASADQYVHSNGSGACSACSKRSTYFEDLSNTPGYYEQNPNQNSQGYQNQPRENNK